MILPIDILPTDKERAPGDQASISIILCAEKDDVEVEYALRTKTNPIGVAAGGKAGGGVGVEGASGWWVGRKMGRLDFLDLRKSLNASGMPKMKIHSVDVLVSLRRPESVGYPSSVVHVAHSNSEMKIMQGRQAK